MFLKKNNDKPEIYARRTDLKKIKQKHNGIWVESKKGENTTRDHPLIDRFRTVVNFTISAIFGNAHGNDKD